MKVFYFGKLNGIPGHQLFEWAPGWLQSADYDAFVAELGTNIDGEFAPHDVSRAHIQGKATLVHRSGFSLLSWWDMTGDSRGGSNSVVIAEGEHSAAVMLEIFEERFPLVARRQTRPIEVGP